MEPVIIIHGGAGDIPDERNEGKNQGTIKAAKIGYEVLIKTNNALDAVEAAVNSMELDENFNAGYGSVLTMDGEVEMEASIMDGSNLKAGCVSLIKDINNPITLARRVMDKTVHNFLAGDSAMKFAKEQNFKFLPKDALITNYARSALNEFKKLKNENDIQFARTEIGKDYGEVGTVGAVAMNTKGNIAVATSTGGKTGKLSGRVGDTPILGSGTYADDKYGGVSTTGDGETIMKFNLAHDIIKRMRFLNQNAQQATEDGLIEMTERLIGTAGAISLDRNGQIGIYFTSKKMAWAFKKGKSIHYGICKGDDNIIFDEN